MGPIVLEQLDVGALSTRFPDCYQHFVNELDSANGTNPDNDFSAKVL